MTAPEKLLNTIEHPHYPCPACGVTEPLQVFLRCARWRCGHTRRLPPIGDLHGPRPAARITQRVKR